MAKFRYFIIVSLIILSVLLVVFQFFLKPNLDVDRYKVKPFYSNFHEINILLKENKWVNETKDLQGVVSFPKEKIKINSFIYVPSIDVYNEYAEWARKQLKVNRREKNVKIHQDTPFDWEPNLSFNKSLGVNFVSGVDFWSAYSFCRSSHGRLANVHEVDAYDVTRNSGYDFWSIYNKEIVILDKKPIDFLKKKLDLLIRKIRPSKNRASISFACSYENEISFGDKLKEIKGNFFLGEHSVGYKKDTWQYDLTTMGDEYSVKDIILERSLNRGRLSVSKPIKVKDFEAFLDNPLVKLGFFDAEYLPSNYDYKPLYWDKQLENEDDYVRYVSWWAADAYASYIGNGWRLPSDIDFEIVAKSKGLNYNIISENCKGESKKEYLFLRDKPEYLDGEILGDLQYIKLLRKKEFFMSWSSLIDNSDEWIRVGSMSLPLKNYIPRICAYMPEYKSFNIGIVLVK